MGFLLKKKTKTPGSWIVGSPGGWPRLYMAQPLAGRLTAARDDFRVVGVIYHGYTMVIDGDTRPGKLRVCELEHGPVEIVDFLIQHGDFPVRELLVITRGCIEMVINGHGESVLMMLITMMIDDQWWFFTYGKWSIEFDLGRFVRLRPSV